MLGLFLRLTVIVAVGIVLVIVAAFLLKIALIAAIIAAIGVAGYFLYSLIRRRSGLPIIR